MPEHRAKKIDGILNEDGITVEAITLTPENGKVRKMEIRRALNSPTRLQFVRDVNALCKGNEEFRKLYDRYKSSRKIPWLLAVFIIRHLDPDRKLFIKGQEKPKDLQKEIEKLVKD